VAGRVFGGLPLPASGVTPPDRTPRRPAHTPPRSPRNQSWSPVPTGYVPGGPRPGRSATALPFELAAWLSRLPAPPFPVRSARTARAAAPLGRHRARSPPPQPAAPRPALLATVR